MGDQLSRLLRSALNPTNRAVIHCHDPLSAWAAACIRSPETPLVQTVHGPWSREHDSVAQTKNNLLTRELRRVEQQAFQSSDLLLPVDQGQAAILKDEFEVPPERIVVIENAVDVETLQEIAASATAARPDFPLFIVARRLVPKNGVEFAIRALARMGRSDVQMCIAGDGPLRRSLQSLAGELGVAPQVQFLGNVPRREVIRLFGRATGAIVPSVPDHGVVEATSLAVLEAMACGVPVIGSDIGGIAEILEGGKTGYLVPAADVDGLARQITAVLNLKVSERQQLCAAAQQRVRSKFGCDQWLERILTVYRECTERKTGALEIR
jgi:glycosyltransferase involved in cell wall biosynthesis